VSGISPAAKQPYKKERPPLRSSPPATEKKTALVFREDSQHTSGLLSYPTFPSAPLTIFPKELFGVDSAAKKKKTGNPNNMDLQLLLPRQTHWWAKSEEELSTSSQCASLN